MSLAGKKKIAVLTGAGVSAESGLATFRGNNGLWGKYDPDEVASIEGWYRNRRLVLNFYNDCAGRSARSSRTRLTMPSLIWRMNIQ